VGRPDGLPPSGIVQSLEGCLRAAHLAGASTGAVRDRIDRLAASMPTLDGGPLIGLLQQDRDIDEAEAALARIGRGARTIVFLGAGTDALAGQAMAQLAGWNIPGAAGDRQKQRPRTRFYDSIDPHTLSGALAPESLAGLRFVVADSRGEGVVQLTQARAVLAALDAAGFGGDAGDRVVGVVARGSSLLSLLQEAGATCLEVRRAHRDAHYDAGMLSLVGQLPALARGLDVRTLRAAALAEWRRLHAGGVAQSAPARAAAVMSALLAQARIGEIVVVPQADRLGRLADWLAATWSEHLAGVGSNVGAHGPAAASRRAGIVRRRCLVVALALGAGAARRSPVGRIVADAQDRANADFLTEARARGDLVRTIHIGALDEATIGALLMQLLLEPSLCAMLQATR
jgi:glucose-6-phosphate isomerase